MPEDSVGFKPQGDNRKALKPKSLLSMTDEELRKQNVEAYALTKNRIINSKLSDRELVSQFKQLPGNFNSGMSEEDIVEWISRLSREEGNGDFRSELAGLMAVSSTPSHRLTKKQKESANAFEKMQKEKSLFRNQRMF